MFTFTEIKYQLFRNKGRSVLTVLIAALLVGSMAFYLGNIQSSEASLQNLSESLPVTVRVVSRNGSSRSGLAIDAQHFDALNTAGVHDVMSISLAAGAFDENAKGDGENFYGGDTQITGANTIAAVSGLLEENLTMADGQDSSFFAGNEPVCAIHENYAKAHDLKLGDEVKIAAYGIRYSSLGYVYIGIGDVTLKVIGTYKDSGDSSLPSMCVPLQWLREATEKAGMPFYYDSMSAILDNPMEMNSFKEQLPKLAFMEVFGTAENNIIGDAISVEDELFVKTASELKNNLIVYRNFLIPFFALVIGLVTLVTFMMLRSSQRDMAIASSLGRSKWHSGFTYFLGTLIADAVGCIIALPIMYFTAGIGLMQILIIFGLFIFFACVGIALALIFLLRFDTLGLLTKID